MVSTELGGISKSTPMPLVPCCWVRHYLPGIYLCAMSAPFLSSEYRVLLPQRYRKFNISSDTPVPPVHLTPVQLISSILEKLQYDQQTLASCIRVNTMFYNIAIDVVWRESLESLYLGQLRLRVGLSHLSTCKHFLFSFWIFSQPYASSNPSVTTTATTILGLSDREYRNNYDGSNLPLLESAARTPT